MEKKKRISALFLTMVLLLSLLAGCAGAETTEGESTAEFRAWIGSDEIILDPVMAQTPMQQSVIAALYEGLLCLGSDKNGQTVLQPGVAREYQITENFDGTVSYVFTLRSTARWTDGKRVKADDFVFAWRRLADPDTQSPMSSLLTAVTGYDAVQESGDETLLGVEAKDSETFVVTLNEAEANFLEDVCTAAATVPLRRSIVSQENWATPANMATNGAFVLGGRGTTGTVELVKNESYYASRLVKVECISLLRSESAEAAYALYENGALDYVHVLTEQKSEELLAAGENVLLQPTVGVGFVLYNHLTDVFSNQNIRAAFDLAIDRGAIVNNASAGAVTATGFVPHGVVNTPDTEEDFRTYAGAVCVSNPEEHAEHIKEAERLLTQSGHYGGAGLDGLRYIYVDSEENRELALALQRMWSSAINVTVTLEALSQEDYEARLAAGEYDLAGAFYAADNSDAMSFLSLWNSESDTNVLGYVNTAYDLLLGVGESTSDFTARAAFLHDAEVMLLGDYALSPLYFSAEPYLLRSNWQGLTRDPFGRSYFTGLAMTAEAPTAG